MLVFHNEYAFRCSRKVLAILLMSSNTWLVDLKVGTQIVNLDNAQITFIHHAAMREYALLQKRGAQAETQEKTSNTVHNHVPILTTQRCHLKE